MTLPSCVGRSPGPESDTETARFVEITVGEAVTDRASTAGASWLDIDTDGRPELFVTNGYDVSSQEAAAQPDRFYKLGPDGRLQAISLPGLTGQRTFSSGSAWADFDNDGDLDVFISNQRDQENSLYRNDNTSNDVTGFKRIQSGPIAEDKGWSYSASWVDVDRDGWIDLFVCNGGLSHAGENFLYRNIDGRTFEKVVDGSIVTDVQASATCIWGDYDNDGDADLFVTSHGVARGSTPENRLYRNEGKFKFELMVASGLESEDDPSAAAAWGDFDNDGDLDLCVGNLYGMANRLYRNLGNGTFDRVEGQPLTTDGGTTHSVNWGDIDNDGDLDLLVVNWGAAASLYLNTGSGQFERSTDSVFAGLIGYGASASLADYDADGDLDIYIAHWPNSRGADERNRLIENRMAAGNWIKFRLQGTASNRAALGARIELLLTDRGRTHRQLREISGTTSFRSQDELTQHFGLGDADHADLVIVRWPTGQTESWANLGGNQTLTLVEGEGSPVRHQPITR